MIYSSKNEKILPRHCGYSRYLTFFFGWFTDVFLVSRRVQCNRPDFISFGILFSLTRVGLCSRAWTLFFIECDSIFSLTSNVRVIAFSLSLFLAILLLLLVQAGPRNFQACTGD